ncbi:MAG: hypothetical protein FWD05_03255 [Oscillospiraceae bacterium]|nr:hypothetical protein [Oscillospiraceae bacterium]
MSKNFRKLTPIDSVELGIYADAIDKAFSDSDLKNIAISGSYGSGKSSVLETYKKKRPKKKFLHISLAKFSSPSHSREENISSKCDKVTGETNVEQNKYKSETPSSSFNLEGKILNQLVHQIPLWRIAQTNLKVKQKISMFRFLCEAGLLAIGVLALIYVILFEQWSYYIINPMISLTNDEGIPVISPEGWLYDTLTFLVSPQFRASLIMLVIVCALIFTYRFVVLQKTKKIIQKISIKGAEIEILGENKDSYFDKHLNEVLYLFEHSGHHAIVFEDIDRFDANQIFVRLREINTLINVKRKRRFEKRPLVWFRACFRRTYKPLRFIYLLRDDIFESKDRTKFFDYIVPIVPVVDGSNSYDKLVGTLKEGGINEKFDHAFLKKLLLYVDEMRLLLNIYNEFLVYKECVVTTGQDWNKMFAMITYKNIFPQDFAELQLDKGYVHTVLNNKHQHISEEVSQLQQKIVSIEGEIETIENEHLVAPEEFHTVLAVEQMASNYGSYTAQEIKTISLTGDRKVKYDSRISSLEAKTNGKIEKLRKRIEEKRSRIEKLESVVSFFELAQTADNAELFKATEKNSVGKPRDFRAIEEDDYFQLLKFLLSFGWIDEHYKDFMNIFYPSSLSIADRTFLRSITDRKALPFDYELDSPEKVRKHLSATDFAQPEIRNYMLVYDLLNHSKTEGGCLGVFFSYMVRTNDHQFLISVFSKAGQAREAYFVSQINSAWPAFLSTVMSDEEINRHNAYKLAISRFVLEILHQSSASTIKDVNIDNCITDYIQNNPKYLELGGSKAIYEKKDIEQIIQCFDWLGVKFEAIDDEVVRQCLFQQVYERNQYAINKKNIWLMLKTMYELEETPDFIHKNLSLIMTQKDSPLAKYVWKSIDEYIEIVLSFCEEEITDKESIALRVLHNEEGIREDIRLSYLKALKTKVESIADIPLEEDFWQGALKYGVCDGTPGNIFAYFEQYEMDDILVSVINGNDAVAYRGFDFPSDEAKSEFFVAIIVCNEIEDSRYIAMATSLNMIYKTTFAIEHIPHSKMSLLVENKIIRMSEDNLLFIRDNYPNNLLQYIGENISEYVNIMTGEIFLLEEALHTLNMSVSDGYKTKLLSFSDEPISVSGQSYNAAIKMHILTNNFDENDLDEIIDQYPREGLKVKAAIEKNAVGHIDEIIENRIMLPTSLLDILLTKKELTEEKKLKLLASIAHSIEKEMLLKYLKQLGYKSYARVFEGEHPKIPDTPEHSRIAAVMERKGWISSFSEDSKDNRYLRLYGKRSRKKI